MTYITCRLTAKNRDQLRNPTLSSRVWVTFTFFNFKDVIHFSVKNADSCRFADALARPSYTPKIVEKPVKTTSGQ